MGACSDAKVTVMILNVDLDCCQCYIKVKKLLCKFPQIRDQVYDEKQNTVTITVVCCSPDKIMGKLCYKGGKSIKGIAIKESKKSEPEKEKSNKPTNSVGKTVPAPAPGPVAEPDKKEKPKAAGESEKSKSKPADDQQKPPAAAAAAEKSKKKVTFAEGEAKSDSKKESGDAPKAKAVPAAAAAQAPPAKLLEPQAQWVPGYPPVPPPQMYPVTVYYGGGGSCYDGVPAPGPCYQGQGYGYPYGRQPGPPAGYYSNHTDYFSEENPTACSIM